MIKEVFESISEKMQSDFEKVTKLLSHPGVKGTARENALMHYLRPHKDVLYIEKESLLLNMSQKNYPGSKKKCTTCTMNTEKRCARITRQTKR